MDILTPASFVADSNLVVSTSGHGIAVHIPVESSAGLTSTAIATLHGNVVMGVKATSAQQVSDLTPAAFWISAPWVDVR